jgi:hypothetical protein
VEAKGVRVEGIGALVGVEGGRGVVSGRVYGMVRGGKVSWSVSGGEYEGKVRGGVAVGVKVEGVGDGEGL